MQLFAIIPYARCMFIFTEVAMINLLYSKSFCFMKLKNVNILRDYYLIRRVFLLSNYLTVIEAMIVEVIYFTPKREKLYTMLLQWV